VSPLPLQVGHLPLPPQPGHVRSAPDGCAVGGFSSARSPTPSQPGHLPEPAQVGHWDCAMAPASFENWARLRQWPGFFFQSRERARNDKPLDRIYGFAMTSTRFRDYMLRAMSCERTAGVVMDGPFRRSTSTSHIWDMDRKKPQPSKLAE
jgi:hypothetical protein